MYTKLILRTYSYVICRMKYIAWENKVVQLYSQVISFVLVMQKSSGNILLGRKDGQIGWSYPVELYTPMLAILFSIPFKLTYWISLRYCREQHLSLGFSYFSLVLKTTLSPSDSRSSPFYFLVHSFLLIFFFFVSNVCLNIGLVLVTFIFTYYTSGTEEEVETAIEKSSDEVR